MSILVKDLPPIYRDLAIEEIKKQHPGELEARMNYPIQDAFSWMPSPQKDNFWYEVYMGKSPSIPGETVINNYQIF